MKYIQLEDCCEILDSMRVPITATDRKEGPYPYYGANGVQDYVDNFIFDDELVLLAEDGGNFGSKTRPIAYRVSGKCWINNHAHVLKPKMGLNVDFLCYSLMFYNTNGLVNGATRQKLTQTTMKKMMIPKLPLEKQMDIVNKLNKIVAIRDSRRQELQKLDALIKARFVELMNWYPSNNYLKEFISSYKAERCGERDLPVLSITKEDGIVFQSEKFKKRIASVDASTYKVVPKGKLVQGIHIDERNFAIQNIADEGIVSPAYKIWNVDESKAIPEVLAFAMRTDKTMSYISSKFTGSVKRRESISMEDFMVTPIDLPEMNVQIEFYEFMMQVDKSKVMALRNGNQLKILKNILHTFDDTTTEPNFHV